MEAASEATPRTGGGLRPWPHTEPRQDVSSAGAHDLLRSTEWWVADRVTQAICIHHRRRLQRVGWEAALDAPPGGWAAGDPLPRQGNKVEVLIDGAEALPRIAGELKQARLTSTSQAGTSPRTSRSYVTVSRKCFVTCSPRSQSASRSGS